MIETVVESIRVSLVNQNRVVILKEVDGSRHLPIWIGVYEAEAIAMEIQGVTAARPLPYDLVKAAITDLGGSIERVAVTELTDEIYYARIYVRQGEREVEIDSRPSDAIAIAVRAEVPILVDERVMDQASLVPEPDEDDEAAPAVVEADSAPAPSGADEEALGVFRDFINTLDFDDFDKKRGS
jgi:bifunctional DNase/RNase